MKSFVKLNILLFKLFKIGLSKLALRKASFKINYMIRKLKVRYAILNQYFYAINKQKYSNT